MFKNILANYIGRIWGIISVFVFVPFYIKILGLEAYAVITFYTVILTIMYFADAGLSATLNREIAKHNDKQYIGNMLFTIERVYLFICLLIFIIIFSLSDIIASNWLNSQTISSEDLRIYVILMGLSIAFQLFTSLENSGLMGLEKQVLSNGIQISSSFFRSAVVLIPLNFYPTLLTFFLWQVSVTIIFFFITRYNLWKFIRMNISYKFDFTVLKTVGGFAGGMMLMAIISSLNTQIDKLVISKILSLKEFGYYSMASMLSQVPMMVISPIGLAILPRMVKFTSENQKEKMIEFFHINSYIVSTLATTFAVVLFLFTKDYVFIWTHNITIANNIDHITKILLLGGLFLSFQVMPYYLAIANGHTKTNVRLGIGVIVFVLPMLIFFVNHYGIIGATFTWLIINVFACLYLGYILVPMFLGNEFNKWMIFDLLIPVVIAVVIGFLGYFVTLSLAKGYLVLIYSAIIGLVILGLNLIVFNIIINKTVILKLSTLKKNLEFLKS